MSSFWEARIASLITAGGLGWCVHVVTKDFTSIANITVPQGGPAEVCALGIVIWLHAKYRRSIRER